ncbi:sigma-54-dependent Fis family transcriptional regulator [uncultured Thiothrix sp.]|uniref:sigma-54 interaction domain-containing protein n=1 Tax=uncultured Thiothrix sp. TaxID=223185 RepID=UPI00261CEDC7|nr:sigma-54 dependent transcriptional regulator [uncultured Thiothrix sp.]
MLSYSNCSDSEPLPLITLPNAQTLTTSIRATALVFEDPKSLELLAYIRNIAPSDANVLIMGETGTGKELIARHVHALSKRQQGPFIAVNCGALTEQLAESELFGHEKGAFTGALSSKIGWFEAANGGTLFLDEIGDLPLSLQVKLLRVLQEREVVRLGSRKAIPINVRIIAATNVRLEEAVAAGRFREDLFYRLHVAKLSLLPLRERKGDIMPLACYFLQEYRRRLKLTTVNLSSSAKQKLLQHAWPGNIRELENAIHYALLVCHHNLIQAEDFQLTTLQVVSTTPPINQTQPENLLSQALTQLYDTPNPELYDFIENTVIKTAYEYCHYNQVQTAQLLGISRNILRARLIKANLLQNRKLIAQQI